MAKFSHDTIIIGGGAGGLVATVGLARLGVKVALVERHKKLGGDCLFHGCVPSKSLLRSAAVYHQAKHFSDYGLPTVKLPRPDLAQVNKRVQGVIKTISDHDSIERFEKLGAEVIIGDARFLSEHQVRVDGKKTISAKNIIIAAGSGPAELPIPGLKESGYITNLDIFTMKKLPEHLLVIGAGPIGVEMSMAFSRLGSKVTIIDRTETILLKDDPDMSKVVQEEMFRCGATHICNAAIERIEGKGKSKTIHYKVDGKSKSVTGDCLLVSAGRKGNAVSMELEKAGVEIQRSFIPTNDKLQTSTKNIYAIGDSNGKFLFTHVAAAEASVIVRRVGLRAGGRINYRAVPWVTYTDPELASIGYNEMFAKADGVKYRTVVANFDENDRALAEGAPEGRIKILIDRKSKVLGVQIVGYHAGDLLAPALFAVNQKWKASALMGPIFPYPTTGDIYKGAVGNFMAPKLFNNRVRGFLKLLHGYRGKQKD